MGNERFVENLRILKRAALVTVIMITLDVAGLGIFFYVQGLLEYYLFMRSLILLLLLEGCLIGTAGGFVYIILGAFRAARPGMRNPAITEKQQEKGRERGESRHQWSVAMITAGLLLILIGFLTSSIFQI